MRVKKRSGKEREGKSERENETGQGSAGSLFSKDR